MDSIIPQDDQQCKRCNKCKELKPLSEFSKDKSKKDGHQSKCKPCACETAKAWQQANPERNNEYQKAWRKANSETKKAWRKANSERNRKTQKAWRETNSEYQKTWREANSEAIKSYCHRRRACKKNAEGTHTSEDVRLQYNSQKGKCWHCGVELNGVYHVDHLIPLAKGGTNAANNIVCACAKCNLSKGAKTTQEWNGRLF